MAAAGWCGRSTAALLAVAFVAMVSAIPAHARVGRHKAHHHKVRRVPKIEPVRGVFTSDGHPIEEFHCVPPRAGKYPVVMLLHGCAPKDFATPQFKEMCSQLAEHGYYTMFIEYYGLAGTPNCSDLAMTPLFSLEPNTPLPDDIWMRDLIAARDSLAQDPKADTKRLGVIGFSFGGTLAVITAALNPGVISTIVDYYGYSNERVEDAVTHVARFPPTLILQGDEDRRAHVTDSIHLRNAIAKRQPETEVHVYPRVEHAFNFHDAAGYDHDASADAWSRTLRFLDMELK